jgi:atypical dual specificity phosphatase
MCIVDSFIFSRVFSLVLFTPRNRLPFPSQTSSLVCIGLELFEFWCASSPLNDTFLLHRKLVRMAAPSKTSPVEKYEDASFGDLPTEEIRSVDISKVIAVWLSKAMAEIEELEEKVEGQDDGKPKLHAHYHINFPVALTSAQRKLVHQHAYTLKLRSTSHGDGEKRFNRVSLINRGNLDPAVLEIVSSDKLQEAIDHRQTTKNSKVPKGMSPIIDHLFLGSGKDAQDKDALLEAGVSIVLNVTAEWRISHPNDFTHHRIELADSVRQSLDVAMEKACEIISNAKTQNPPSKILVHCVMGRSRSAAIVMAYLVKYENMTLKEAFELTHKARPIVRPNSRFLSDLIAWEVRHKGSPTLDVDSWVEIVGIHGSQRNGENWKEKNLPPPIKLEKEDARSIAQEAAASYLNEKLYLDVVDNFCQKSYEHRYIQKFLQGIRTSIEADKPFVTNLRTKGVTEETIVKSAHLIAKEWYIAKIPKDTKPKREKKGGKATAATESEKASSSAPSDVPASPTSSS